MRSRHASRKKKKKQIEMDSPRQRCTACVRIRVHMCSYVRARFLCMRVCVCTYVCVLIATVREPLSDGQLIGHLTSTEEAARKLAKRATGFNLIPNSFLSRCCPLDNSLSQGNGTKIKKNRIQNRGKIVA